jgi:nucleoid-associated protein YgaU
MAWANENGIKAEYPEEYGVASAAMKDAFVANGTGNYAKVSEKAAVVNATFSDDFQAMVNSDREAAAKAAAELAAAKAAADPAMDDARTRMAWAENNNLASDHVKEFKTAHAAMEAAEKAYDIEAYVASKTLAEEVSATLSDDFQKNVLAQRAEAANAAEAAAKAAEAIKIAAEADLNEAQTRMAWANENGIKAEYPEEYGVASAAMKDAFVANGTGNYAKVSEKAAVVNATFSDDFQAMVNSDREAAAKAAAELTAAKAAADPAMDDARTRMAWAENNNLVSDHAKEFKTAHAAMEAAEKAYDIEAYVASKTLAEEVSATLSDDFQKNVLAHRAEAERIAAEKAAKQAADEAEAAAKAKEAARVAAAEDLKAAQDKYEWAKKVNGVNNYPSAMGTASSKLSVAGAMYAAGDYPNTSKKSKEAIAALDAVKEFAPLPAQYVVRLIPQRRDCLWRIAEYAFIYNNPLKWPVLYEANKKTFKDPSNPDLIFPGQVLVIPSIKGEAREGTWDPRKTYKPLAK